MEKLYYLWYHDLRARRRFQLWTILIAFAYGVFNSLALGRPENRVTFETLGVVVLLTVVFSAFYCLQTGTSTERSTVNLKYAHFRDVFLPNRKVFEGGLAAIVILLSLWLIRRIPGTRIEAASIDLRLNRAISSPTSLSSNAIDEISSLVTTATTDRVSINPRLVNSAGKRVVDESRENPGAWPAALALLNYRSSANPVRVVNTVPVPPGSKTRYGIPGVFGRPAAELSEIPYGVAPEDAARFEAIGRDLNQQLQFGATELILTGGAVTIDDQYVRHVVFDGVEVHYAGGPLKLEDVVFTNCTFVFGNTQAARKLGHALLRSSRVDFENPG